MVILIYQFTNFTCLIAFTITSAIIPHYYKNSNYLILYTHAKTGLSRGDLRFLYQFLGHLILAPKFKKGRKRNLKKKKKIGFTPCKAEWLLQGMELQEKEAQKD